MSQRLIDRKVAVFVEEGFEDLEFWVTVMRLREEGAEVTILGREAGREITGKNGLKAASEAAPSDVSPEVFDGVVVPGGWAPDKLRRYEDVTGFVRRAHEAGKIIGLICHAGLVGISAGIVKGSKATGSLGVKDDLVNAGAEWVDEPAFRDGNIVWGRVVDDIPDFCRELVEAITKAP
jgi:protease I